MEQPGPARPRVSRETRLLLATILISLAALWTLARIRFPDRPAAPNSVPPLLTQFAAPPAFDDLASEVSNLETRLLASLVAVELPVSPLAAALRVRDDIGVTLVAPADTADTDPTDRAKVLAHDPASGLALITVPAAPAPELASWAPQRAHRPRYFIASDVSRQGASLRPVFIGRLHPTTIPAWPGEIWVLPARADVAPRDLLFTTEGALAGLVIAHAGTRALVPGDTVLREADRLRIQKPAAAGWLGIDVQALTPLLTSGSDARIGVMVAWVHPNGPAVEQLVVMDVIESANGEPITSPDEWRLRVARLVEGETIKLGVRRRGAKIEVPLTAAALFRPARPAMLGLTMRTVPGIGAEVVHIAEGSAAARAGLRRGDLITAIGGIRTPTAPQVAQAFAAAPAGRSLLVAITTGDVHRVHAVEKQ